MSEENYFKVKLQISKDTLAYTKSQLESTDNQIRIFIQRHEYDLKILNQKISHLQQIEKNMEERILSLQKKIDDGYVAVDMNTGKGYKSRDDMHKVLLAKKAQDSKDNYKKMKAAYDLKKKKGMIPKPVVEPPTGETIESQQERELRLLKERADELVKQQQELKDTIKAEKKATREANREDLSYGAELLEPEEEEIEIPVPEILNALGPIDETEINKDKVKCPECQKYYTKGGAFTAHYKTHYPNGKV